MLTKRVLLPVLLCALLAPALPARGGDESASVTFLEDPPSLDAVLEKAAAEGKDVVIDFTADWCGWCHKLEEDVFSKSEAVEPFARYVCARFDVDKAVGRKIADAFHVSGYPTVLFLDAKGVEIDRITGYAPLAPYLKDVARISRDENTLRALKAYVDDHADDIEVAALYVEKLTQADPKQAAVMLPSLLARSEEADPLSRAKLLLLSAQAHRDAGRNEDAFAAWERVVDEVPGTDEAGEAAYNAGWLGQSADPRRALALVEKAMASETRKEALANLSRMQVQLLRESMAAGLVAWAKRAWDDGQALNEAAWEAYLRRVHPEQAVLWAERAVELTDRDPAVLDTLANLLFETGRMDEAVEVESEAMRKADDPDMRREFQEVLLRMKAVRLHRRQTSGK